MKYYRKHRKHLALSVLLCFLAALTGAPALAGHACCGNCGEPSPQHPLQADATMVPEGCCPVQTACTCSFQSENDRVGQVYAIPHVSLAFDDQASGLALAGLPGGTDKGNRNAFASSSRSDIRLRSGPIYLVNQSFLC